MKRFTPHWLMTIACLILCSGCSTQKPSHERSATVTAPAIVQSQTTSATKNPATSFVHGWLIPNGAPAPDYSMGPDNDNNLAWIYGLIGGLINK